jgi:hypothetical protein
MKLQMVPISDPFGSVDFSEERASMIMELYLTLTKSNSNNSNILIMTHRNFADKHSIIIMFLLLFCFYNNTTTTIKPLIPNKLGINSKGPLDSTDPRNVVTLSTSSTSNDMTETK